jgi:hypothetical protein
MLDELLKLVESGTAENILYDPKTQWETFEAEEPRFERVWTQLGTNQLAVNRIHRGLQSYPHPHPWPFAVLILQNSYRMTIGYGEPTSLPVPPVALTLEVAAGSSYEMIDPNGWHDISPIGEPVISLMLKGPYRRASQEGPSPYPPMTPSAKGELLSLARLLLASRVPAGPQGNPHGS